MLRKEKEIETQRPRSVAIAALECRRQRLLRAQRVPLERDLRYATMRGKKRTQAKCLSPFFVCYCFFLQPL
jgi:hypothetical protein